MTSREVSDTLLVFVVGLFTNLTTQFAEFLTAPPPVMPHKAEGRTGYLPRGLAVTPEKTTRGALWQLPNCSTQLHTQSPPELDL